MVAFNLLELIGWGSGILLGICSVPLAWETLKNKRAPNINTTFISLWLGGEVLGLIYTVSLSNLPLISNYLVNTAALLVVVYYLIKNKKEDKSDG